MMKEFGANDSALGGLRWNLWKLKGISRNYCKFRFRGIRVNSEAYGELQQIRKS